MVLGTRKEKEVYAYLWVMVRPQWVDSGKITCVFNEPWVGFSMTYSKTWLSGSQRERRGRVEEVNVREASGA